MVNVVVLRLDVMSVVAVCLDLGTKKVLKIFVTGKGAFLPVLWMRYAKSMRDIQADVSFWARQVLRQGAKAGGATNSKRAMPCNLCASTEFRKQGEAESHRRKDRNE